MDVYQGEQAAAMTRMPKLKEEEALVMANGGEDHQRKYFKGHCKECGLYGHKDKDCWEHEKNAHRRPRWWKSRKNQDETEACGVELCLASLTHGQDFCSAR